MHQRFGYDSTSCQGELCWSATILASAKTELTGCFSCRRLCVSWTSSESLALLYSGGRFIFLSLSSFSNSVKAVIPAGRCKYLLLCYFRSSAYLWLSPACGSSASIPSTGHHTNFPAHSTIRPTGGSIKARAKPSRRWLDTARRLSGEGVYIAIGRAFPPSAQPRVGSRFPR